MNKGLLLFFIGIFSFTINVFAQINPNLTILQENSRYFQYKGLPCVLFWGTHHYGWNGYPNESQVLMTSSYANFITIQACNYRYSDYASLWKIAKDQAHWDKLGESIKYALEKDVLVHLYFYDGNFSPEKRKYDAPTDFFSYQKFDEPLDAFGLPGISRRDIHIAMIDIAVKTLWKYPNIIFDPAFEIVNSYRWGKNADEFQIWWVQQMKEKGKSINPQIEHLFSTMWGGNSNIRDGKRSHPRGNQYLSHPRNRSMDMIMGEHDQDGFFCVPEDNSDTLYSWKVPLIRMAVHAPDWHFGKYHDIGGAVHNLMKDQIYYGIQTGEHYNFDGNVFTYKLSSPQLRSWMLQTRWYLENIETWADEPGKWGGDEITREKLPEYRDTERPELTNPVGFVNGVKVTTDSIYFSCIYKDNENDNARLAEVWIDMDQNGRFAPDYADGERFKMHVLKNHDMGTHYFISFSKKNFKKGNLAYVFRFANNDWYPPKPCELTFKRNEGINYNHHVILLE
jgi:hypothetical protein